MFQIFCTLVTSAVFYVSHADEHHSVHSDDPFRDHTELPVSRTLEPVLISLSSHQLSSARSAKSPAHVSQRLLNVPGDVNLHIGDLFL